MALEILKVEEVAQQYVKVAIDYWLWEELCRMWSRSHVMRTSHPIADWVKGLGSRLDELRSIEPNLLPQSEMLAEMISTRGMRILTLELKEEIQLISLRARSWVNEKRQAQILTLSQITTLETHFRDARQLPNPEERWTEIWSIGPYKSGGATNHWSGEWVNRYKYRKVDEREKEQIANEITTCLSEFIHFRYSPIFVHHETPPFDVCIGVPSNSLQGKGLPQMISSRLATRHAWLRDVSEKVVKSREIQSIKNLTTERKRAELEGLYRINADNSRAPRFGILVFDDVYTSGCTTNAILQSLEEAYPSLPKYCICLTRTKDVPTS